MKRMISRLVGNAYDFTTRAVRTLTIRRDSAPSGPSNNVFTSILSPFESYAVSLQSLLIWERPYLSAVCFVLLNCLFWLVVSWNRNFFSIVAITALVLFLYRTWVDQIWPEIRVSPPRREEEDENEEWIRVHPQHVSVSEVSRYISDFQSKALIWWKDMMRLREANHGLFCLLWCAVFSFTAFIGHMVPGVVIVYCIVLALSLGPGIALHLIPSTIYDQLADLFVEDTTSPPLGACKKPCDNDSDLEEFLPEQSPDLLRQLSLQHDSVLSGMDSLLPQEGDDDEHHMSTIRELGLDSFVCESEESSLYTGLGAFPSVEEERESDLEDDFSPGADLPAEEENKNGIHFVPTHFKEDSSESENSDAVFTKGLSFGPTPDVKEPQEGPAGKEETKVSTHTKKVSTSSEFDDELMDFEILEGTDIS